MLQLDGLFSLAVIFALARKVPAVNTAGFHINYTMKYKLNIDTLVMTAIQALEIFSLQEMTILQ
jgi:hypothetical protein